MSKIHQMGDEYYIEFMARGLLYQQKAGRDLAQAQELLSSIEQKIQKGEMLLQSRQIDLEIFFLEYFKYAQTRYHPATLQRLRSTVEHFKQFLQLYYVNVKLLSEITPRVIEDYKAYGIKLRQAKQNLMNPKIINLTLILLKEILDFGIKTSFIQDNPVMHVRLVEIKTNALRILSDTHCAMIFEKLDVHYEKLFRFMRYTGLRPQEIIHLSWQQVDLHRQMIFVGLREIPLMVPAIKILELLNSKVIDHKAVVFQHSDGGKMTVKQISNVFDEACRKSGLSVSYSVTSLRSIFIVKLLEKKVPLLSIGRMAGIFDVAKLMYFSSFIAYKVSDN